MKLQECNTDGIKNRQEGDTIVVIRDESNWFESVNSLSQETDSS